MEAKKPTGNSIWRDTLGCKTSGHSAVLVLLFSVLCCSILQNNTPISKVCRAAELFAITHVVIVGMVPTSGEERRFFFFVWA